MQAKNVRNRGRAHILLRAWQMVKERKKEELLRGRGTKEKTGVLKGIGSGSEARGKRITHIDMQLSMDQWRNPILEPKQYEHPLDQPASTCFAGAARKGHYERTAVTNGAT